MKSKVQFDLNGQNKAVISAKITSTSDVRDKVAKSFTESFQYASILATVYCVHAENVFNEETGKEQNMEHIEIKPVGPSWEDCIHLSQLLGQQQLEYLFNAFLREINFRKRTSYVHKAYNFEQLEISAKEHTRDYSIEDGTSNKPDHQLKTEGEAEYASTLMNKMSTDEKVIVK